MNRNVIKLNMVSIFAFTIMLVYLLTKTYFGNDFSFEGAVDANENWKIAKSICDGIPYHSYVEYRGFMWVGVLSIFHCLESIFGINSIVSLMIFNSFIFSILVTIVLPSLFEYLTRVKISVYKKLFFIIVIFYFFKGHFLYPLTDFVSFTFAVLSINFLIKFKMTFSIKTLLLSSLFISISILMRGNYKLTFIILLILLLIFIRNTGIKNIVSKVIIFIFPFLLLSYVNFKYVENLSLTTSEKGVFLGQLNAGLNIQKIEPVLYKNNLGINLLTANNIELNHIFSIKEYLKFVLHNPSDMLVIYGQNLFNGLDIKDATVYFADNTKTISFFSFLNYSLLFFGLFVVFIRLQENHLNYENILISSAVIFPAILTVSFGMEPRYMMPLTMFIFMYSIFGISKVYTSYIKGYLLVITYVIFVLVLFLLSSKTNVELLLQN